MIRHQETTFDSGLLIELETQVKVILTSLARPFCCYRKWPVTNSVRTHLSVWQKPVLNHKNLLWKGGRKWCQHGSWVNISLCICHNRRLIIWCKDKMCSSSRRQFATLSYERVVGDTVQQRRTSTWVPIFNPALHSWRIKSLNSSHHPLMKPQSKKEMWDSSSVRR